MVKMRMTVLSISIKSDSRSDNSPENDRIYLCSFQAVSC